MFERILEPIVIEKLASINEEINECLKDIHTYFNKYGFKEHICIRLHVSPIFRIGIHIKNAHWVES